MEKTARIGVDVGGTFTDLVLHDEARGVTWTHKRPTTADSPDRAIVEGIERILLETDTAIGQVGNVVHGTTLITNAVLERTGARVGLITNDGFRDILEMGREIRFDSGSLHARPAPVIVPRHLRRGVAGRTGADGTLHVPLDAEAVLTAARGLVEDHGIEALAIAFLHSYANAEHEACARRIVHEAHPELFITLSAEVAPEIREYERISTACANAYVQPLVDGYLNRVERDLEKIGFVGELYVMLSGGGITTVEEARAFPVRLLESGPAAGAVAAAFVARAAGEDRIITFDMGGTTAKMSLIEDGHPRIKHEFEAARLEKFKPGSGLPLRLTVIDMIEIGSGGGSIAALDGLGLMKVGPRGAGSVPGPVSYGRGGQDPTVTDSDFLIGYLDPDVLLGGEITPSILAAEQAIEERLAKPLGMTSTAAALGIQEVVTESMAAATRTHLAEKGRDPRAYSLMAFGGAGPVHAYALAKLLKVSRIVVPMGAGVISALGFLVAAPRIDDVRSYPASLTSVDWGRVADLFAAMELRARRVLQGTGGAEDDIRIARSADMRYIGQGFEIEVLLPDGELDRTREDDIRGAFVDTYKAKFGRTIQGGRPELIHWRLSAFRSESHIRLAYRPAASGCQHGTRRVHFPGFGEREAVIYDRYVLRPGTIIQGPALFQERESSFGVGPDCTVTVDPHLNLIAEISG